MKELKDGCVRPAMGPIASVDTPVNHAGGAPSPKEVQEMTARVGQEAPDFEANAFIAGEGFRPVRLSDFKGQWIVVCFYPGDFTFV